MSKNTRTRFLLDHGVNAKLKPESRKCKFTKKFILSYEYSSIVVTIHRILFVVINKKCFSNPELTNNV